MNMYTTEKQNYARILIFAIFTWIMLVNVVCKENMYFRRVSSVERAAMMDSYRDVLYKKVDKI